MWWRIFFDGDPWFIASCTLLTFQRAYSAHSLVLHSYLISISALKVAVFVQQHATLWGISAKKNSGASLPLPFPVALRLDSTTIFHAFGHKRRDQSGGGWQLWINLLPLTAFATRGDKAIVTMASFICFASTNCHNSIRLFFCKPYKKLRVQKIHP